MSDDSQKLPPEYNQFCRLWFLMDGLSKYKTVPASYLASAVVKWRLGGAVRLCLPDGNEIVADVSQPDLKFDVWRHGRLRQPGNDVEAIIGFIMTASKAHGVAVN